MEKPKEAWYCSDQRGDETLIVLNKVLRCLSKAKEISELFKVERQGKSILDEMVVDIYVSFKRVGFSCIKMGTYGQM